MNNFYICHARLHENSLADIRYCCPKGIENVNMLPSGKLNVSGYSQYPKNFLMVYVV